MREAQIYIDGRWTDGTSTVPVLDKFDGSTLGVVHEASQEQVTSSLESLARAQVETDFPHYERFRVLSAASALVLEREKDLVDAIIADTGFTVGDAKREAQRAAQTLLISGEEAKRIHGEVVPLHGAPNATGRIAFTTRHPVGVVCAITPFNSPLNTVAHKIAPALAAGNAVILKPSSLTPLSAGLLVEILLESGLPPKLISVVYGRGSTVGEWLLQSQVPDFYAFTGSTGVGEHIRRTVGLRKTQLELGSLSSTIVCADADLDKAVASCVGAAFRKAGQVCTSVQRLYVHQDVQDDFAAALAAAVGDLRWGDPRRDDTFVGPLISDGETSRIEEWVGAAVSGGASVSAGGERTGTVFAPTVLKDVSPAMDVISKEIFGPVVSLVPFDDLQRAIVDINDTPYGLAAGIFTADIANALAAARQLRMGSVHINETSSSRVDLMPYGGVKASGSGVEGPRYAIEEMTEQRLITIDAP
jgi:succinate-semialdehyde dehydrogenase/glutarate-semialdehyde dehydrogenase